MESGLAHKSGKASKKSSLDHLVPIFERAKSWPSLNDLLGHDLERDPVGLTPARPHHQPDQPTDVLGRRNEEETFAALDLTDLKESLSCGSSLDLLQNIDTELHFTPALILSCML